VKYSNELKLELTKLIST